MKTGRIVVGVAIGLFSAIGSVAAKTVTIGMAIPSYAHGVLWIAQDAGFFKKNGLDVQILVLQGSADAMRLLASGRVDIALAGGDALVKADLAGGDLVAFAGVVNRFYHRIVSRADVKAPMELKGRVVGLPFFGGPQDMAVQTALERWGLGYGTDVKIRNIGAESARLAALEQGVVDAVPSDAALSVVQKLGLHVLGDVPSWGTPFPYMMAVARREFLNNNDEAATSFLRALMEAMDYYKSHPKRSLAILAANAAQERGTEADASELYRQNGPSVYSFPPYPDPRGFETVLRSLSPYSPAAAKARPGDFFTTVYLDRVLGRRNRKDRP